MDQNLNSSDQSMARMFISIVQKVARLEDRVENLEGQMGKLEGQVKKLTPLYMIPAADRAGKKPSLVSLPTGKKGGAG